MHTLYQDVRYGLRQMKRNLGFTLAAVLCIALGIGANTATFSIANSFLRPKPMVQKPERLVRMYIEWASGLKFGSFSYPDYVDLRNRNDVLDGLVAESVQKFHLNSGNRNEAVVGAIVSGNYFSVLGVQPAQGRAFLPEEDRTPGTHAVTVISHGLWQRRFGGDPGIIGRSLQLSGHQFTIIGVTPAGFSGSNIAVEPELWVPLMMHAQALPGSTDLNERGGHWLNFITGRLKPGVTVAQAGASLNAVMNHLAEEYPATNKGVTIVVYPEAEASLHPVVRNAFVSFLALMFAVVGAILLLACANVAGLLLARMSGRRREIAIRLAIGAGRGQLLRQLLVESILLSLVAGGIGLLLGIGLVRMIQAVPLPANLPLKFDVRMDNRVLLFTFAVAVLTGIIFGLAPAWQAIRQNLVSALKEGTQSLGGKSSRLRQAMVIGQVALSLILLIGAGLTIRSLQNVRNLDPGFNPDRQIITSLDLDLQGYKEAAGRQFFRSLRERVTSLPGVASVGLSYRLPLSLSSSQREAVPEGWQTPPDSDDPSIDYSIVDHGYLEAMGIPLLRGRGFAESDNAEGRPVLVVNQKFAERFWPGEDAIGKRVRTAGKEHEVIGVVPTGKYFSLGEDPKPFMYLPWQQNYRGTMTLHVRAQGDEFGLFDPVRTAIRSLDNTLPIADMQTMHGAIGFALLPARLAAGAVSGFAVLALLLAAVGLYGVISFTVSQATKDIAIRMALGAQSQQIISLVMKQGMKLTGLGLAGGLAGGLGLAVLMTRLLYGVSAMEPFAYLLAIVLLGGIALLAAWIPARRATQVDPLVTLRTE